ncbi:calcium-binding protein P-like isoform X2 [Sycon ciliatum]|uniref:calcium-binding protein P-like isoform X2 n=1 Tax=Sycon ciliatum TaxID=27933 RepID=UPI0031F61E81
MSVVTKEGELWKYRNMLSGWAKRYCKLDRNYLHYYTTKFESSPVASAIRGDIMRAAPTQPGWTTYPFSFEVTQRDGTTWYFRANNQADMDVWLEALNAGPTRRSVKLALESKEAQVHGSCSDHIVTIDRSNKQQVSPSSQAHHPTTAVQHQVHPQQPHPQQSHIAPQQQHYGHAQAPPAQLGQPHYQPHPQAPPAQQGQPHYQPHPQAPAQVGQPHYQPHPQAPPAQPGQPHYQPHPQAQLQPALQYAQPPSYNPNWTAAQQEACQHPNAHAPAFTAPTQGWQPGDYTQHQPTVPTAPALHQVGASPPPSYMQATDMPPPPAATGQYPGYQPS